jgi:hypothetical protein
MKFAIGYQNIPGRSESTVDIVADHTEHVREVFFAWPTLPSGRRHIWGNFGHEDWAGQERLVKDLRSLRDLGVRLNLCINGVCFGRDWVSVRMREHVTSVLRYLDQEVGGADTVTTTSLTVARATRRYRPSIDIRASLNMRIDSVEGMAFLAEFFDSYYLHRDLSRDRDTIVTHKRWAEAAGKKLYIVANLCCLGHCPTGFAHDAYESHLHEAADVVSVPDWPVAFCRKHLSRRENWPSVLKAGWIRPEDLHSFEGLCDGIKLATRLHPRPRQVLEAYARGHFDGNLLELFEAVTPETFAPHIVDNARFPAHWSARTATCAMDCHHCRYCDEVFTQVFVDPAEARDLQRVAS